MMSARMKCQAAWLGATFAAALSTGAGAAPGDLDQTFGEFGRVTGPPGFARAACIQDDGKIIVLGLPEMGPSAPIVRYNANGTLDATFGDGGISQVSLDGDDQMTPQAVLCSADSTLLVGGGGRRGFALGRLKPDGRPDSNFGAAGQTVVALGDKGSALMALARQSTGRIVAAGLARQGDTTAAVLVGFHPNGSVDTGFGEAGVVIVSSAVAGSLSMALDAGDGIVVAVPRALSRTVRVILFRYTESGVVDETFGGGGSVTTDIVPGFFWLHWLQAGRRAARRQNSRGGLQ